MPKAFRILDSRFVIRSIFQVGGIWYGRIRDRRMAKVYKVSTRETKRLRAEQALIDWIEEFKRKEARKVRGVYFKKAYREFLDTKDVRSSTMDDYERTYEAVYCPEFGGKFLERITVSDIEKFLKDRRDLSARTKRKYTSELRGFFAWSIRHSYCERNPVEGLKVPRGPKRQGVALSTADARKLLAEAGKPLVLKVEDRRRKWKQSYPPPEHLQVAILTALHTGLRRGNILGLRWRRVDISKRKITFTAEEMKANADHVVPIHPELSEIFQELLRERGRVDPEEPVIGRDLEQITKSFKAALRRAELPEIRWHDLRHSFATWIGQRATFVVYRALLGHSPGSVSEKYFHPPFFKLQRIVDRMPRLLTDEARAMRESLKAAKRKAARA